jgi:hypothetical protein
MKFIDFDMFCTYLYKEKKLTLDLDLENRDFLGFFRPSTLVSTLGVKYRLSPRPSGSFLDLDLDSRISSFFLPRASLLGSRLSRLRLRLRFKLKV